MDDGFYGATSTSPLPQEKQREHRQGRSSHRPLVKWWQLEGEGPTERRWQAEQAPVPSEEQQQQQEAEVEVEGTEDNSGKAESGSDSGGESGPSGWNLGWGQEV